MVIAPIWKDTYYTASGDRFRYRINCGNSVLYRGEAYAYPDGTPPKVCINEICRDYLESEVPDFTATDSHMTHRLAYRDFALYDIDSMRTVETFRFLYNWDYENEWAGNEMTLSEPVNGHLAPGMKMFYTVLKFNADTICWEEI